MFSQNLMHRSSENHGGRPQVTLQVRYNDLDTMKAMHASFTGVHSKYVLERQAKLLGEAGHEAGPNESRNEWE